MKCEDPLRNARNLVGKVPWPSGVQAWPSINLQKMLAKTEFSISSTRKIRSKMSQARENFFSFTTYAPSGTPFDSALRAASTD
jgi:hypothetical protein